MLKSATSIFATLDLGRGHGLDDGGVEVGAKCDFGEGRDRKFTAQLVAVEDERRETEGELGGASGLGNRAESVGGIVSDELVGTVYDHLRSVVIVGAEALGVVALAVGEEVRGEAVVPTERVPVVDVLFEDEDFGRGDGLVFEQAGEQGVGGRATGAAFGGEEFDQDWSTGWVRL